MGSVGFKEWALVCDALERGEQTILIRKGGIAEGRDGFSFRHPEFFLYPTFFHEQVEKVAASSSKWRNVQRPTSNAERSTEQIEVRLVARIEDAVTVSSWETAAALRPFHILNEEVVRERFDYQGTRAIYVAFVRVFRLAPTWSFADDRRFGGCRSWLTLPDPPRQTRFLPVLNDEQHAVRLAHFRKTVAPQVRVSD